MELRSELLRTKERADLHYDSSIKGRYSTMYYYISLSPENRELLNNIDNPNHETFQAFSTYLHETIHWWQHIGSNFGFILHSSFPSFTTDSINHLKELIKENHIEKSLINYENAYYTKTGLTDIDSLNIIINNFHDLEYAKLFAMDNKNIEKLINDNRFFLSVGHCYLIMWINSIHSYADNFDKLYNFLPNYNNWYDKFQEITYNNMPGFSHDVPMKISPLGIKAIFEGQAVFNQIIYLSVVFKENKIILNDFIKLGILHGIYLEAFEHFIRILEEDMPVFVEMNLIALFLLVCDLSINPNNGFPLDIYDYKGFIYKNDPGMRFISICSVISKDKSYYLNKCKNQNKDTYIELSKTISEAIGVICSYESLSIYSEWLKNDSIKELLEEEKIHQYKNINLPFRLFFAKFLRFQEDKINFPEMLCWPGFHLSSKTKGTMTLFEKHKALFIKDVNGETKAMINDNQNSNNIYSTYNYFYYFTMIYEIILKWISEEGEFNLDFTWLLSDRNADEHISKLKQDFKKIFDIDIENIKPCKR